VPETVSLLRERGVDAPVVVGGIIPNADQRKLLDEGVAHVFTPKDYKLAEIMAGIADLAIEHRRGQKIGAPAG
jgi:ethylmalonyl-CoA mutase